MNEAVLGALAEARALGFLGPGPLEAHEFSADAFARALGPIEGRALDLGSGGGVPGLLLAATYVDVPWLLVDRHRRRTSFLARVVTSLGWVGRVEVLRASAEEAAHDAGLRGSFSVVVARSFGPPAITAEVAAGYLQAGGRLAVAEPPTSDPERWPPAGLLALSLERESAEETAVALFRRTSVLDASVPRSWATMERHPRW